MTNIRMTLWKLYFCFGGLLLLCGSCLRAQTSPQLQGTITDPANASVVHARIIVTDPLHNTAVTFYSDANGHFQFSGLRAGHYQISIDATGFLPFVDDHLEIGTQKSSTENVNLQLSKAFTEVIVKDTSSPSGSYKIDVVDLGAWGVKSEIDLPLTINTIPTNLMENQQARSFSDILKYLPSAQMEARGGIDVGRPQTRGFEGSVVQNSRINGMNIIDTTTYPMEMFDHVEVLSGLGGSIYGPQAPAGLFNFVLKQPTDRPSARLGVDVDSPSILTYHGDLDGQIGARKLLGYRLNALHTNGTGYVSESHRRRELGSGVLSAHLTHSTDLLVSGTEFELSQTGFPGGFTYGSSTASTQIPSAPDPTATGLSQPWSGMDLNTTTETAELRHRFGGNWRLMAGGLHQAAERPTFLTGNTLTDNKGDFKATVSSGFNKFTINSNLAHLDGHIKTAMFDHDLSIGTTGYDWMTFMATSSSTYTLGTGNIYAPSSRPFAQPAFPKLGSDYKSAIAWSQSLVAVDTISYKHSWMLTLSDSYSTVSAGNISKAGAVSSQYSDGGNSPSASLLYKLAANMSAYFTYATSIYQSDAAPSSGVANPNAMLPPYHSKQFELGYKIDISGLELSAALYRMNRPFAYTDPTDDMFKIEGKQSNDGLDLMAKGKIRNVLNLYGGLTWLNPELQHTASTTTSGKQVVGVPRVQLNLLGEYALTHIQGLYGDVNIHYTGKRAGTDSNSTWASGYNTQDLGLRYERLIRNMQSTWRLAVTNVGNAQYWASIFPSSINGSSSGYSAFLGSPRLISASVQLRIQRSK